MKNKKNKVKKRTHDALRVSIAIELPKGIEILRPRLQIVVEEFLNQIEKSLTTEAKKESSSQSSFLGTQKTHTENVLCLRPLDICEK